MTLQKIQIVSTKGQVVIPQVFRDFFGIEPKQKVLLEIDLTKKWLVLKPVGDPIIELAGVLKGRTKKKAQQIKSDLRKEEARYEKKY